MNAPDLIADFYRRDLSEAEEDALGAQLQASPEAAERFAALAQQDYSRFGLAEPGDSTPGGRRRAAWVLLLLLAGGSWLAYGLRNDRPAVTLIPEAREELREVRRPLASAPEPAEAAPATAPVEAHLRVSADSAKGPFHAKVEGADASALGVFDDAGRPVGRLRTLGPRDLAWDGRDAQGQAVLPGRYALTVRAGGRVLRQWVEIDVR